MFQGEIGITKGVISSLHRSNNKLNIIVDGKSFTFGNAFACVGFTDSHLHLMYGGEFLSMPDLTKSTSAENCAIIIKKYPFYRGDWLFGRGWNQEQWKIKKLPTKDILDNFFPNQPVCLIRQDGHCLWLNSKALEICNITKYTQEPNGGKIFRNETGEPTGILLDNAIELVKQHLPKYSSSQNLFFIKNCVEFLSNFGITTIHDMDVDPEIIDLYFDYFTSTNPKLNTRIFLSGNKFETIDFKINEYLNEFMKIVGLKFYMDGALGSYGALLSEPYSDNPKMEGLQLLDLDKLYNAFDIASKNKIGVAIHSIGDKATSLILKTLEKFMIQGNKKPKFVRIEHCQVVHKSDIPKFNTLGITASIQPIHFFSDYNMAISRLGKRTECSYPWKSFIDNNVLICSGSDFPIDDPNPIKGIHCLINRKKIDSYKLFGDEAINIEQAIESYTTNAAKSICEPIDKIEIGYSANLVILNINPFQTDFESIEKVKILATISQGNVVFHT